MKNFKYKEPYLENELVVLEVDILPEKYCNFDCIFCPIGRSKNHTDEIQVFDDIEICIEELNNRLNEVSPDIVFINSSGEALVNSEMDRIIDLIKRKDITVRLLSNGYMLNDEKQKSIAWKCDEVIGEIKAITEVDFQKLQRPKDGYTFENHIFNMVIFNNKYRGKFILEITIIKGKSDKDEDIEKLRNLIGLINPDHVSVVTMKGIFGKKLGVSPKRLGEIREQIAKS